PAYGQGMTTAAMAAMWLRTCLGGGADGLTRRYFTGVKRIIDVPWDITVGNDLRFPEVTGPRTARLRILNAHMARGFRAAATDAAVGALSVRVASFMGAPPRVVSPAMMLRVRRGRHGRPTPARQPRARVRT